MKISGLSLVVLLAVILNSGSVSPARAAGCSDPEFAAPRGYLWSGYPASLVVGDFNGDGVADVATANLIPGPSNTVTVALGKGDGTLGTNVNYHAFEDANLLLLRDMNGDGKPDLVVASTLLGSVGVLLGNGNGTFQTNVNLTGIGGYGLAIGDVNGDGTNDIAIVGNVGASVQLGQGNLTFGTNISFLVNAIGAATAVALGDVNADGKLDLVVGASGTSSGQLLVFLGNGDGSFQTNVVTATSTNNNALAIADFNRDGTNDVAGLDSVTGVISIYLSGGHGTLQLHSTYQTGNPGPIISTIQAADLNGDGKPDLVVGDFQTFVLLGNGDGTFQPPVRYQAGGIGVGLGDFDGDGHLDLVATLVSLDNFPNLWLLPGNGDGTFQQAPEYPTGPGPLKPVVADFTGDGKPDIVVPNSFTNTVSVLLNNGDGTYASRVDYFCGTSPQTVAVGDFSGDGKADLLVANLNTNIITLLRGNGNGTFQPATVVTQVLVGVGFAVAGDFTGHGKLDFAIPSIFGLQVFPGNGNGTFGAPITSSSAFLISKAVTGDLNHDGKLDLVVAEGFSTNVNVLIGNGNGTFQPPVTNFAGDAVYDVVVADLTGDGNLDIVVADLCSVCGSAYPKGRIGVLRGNGNGTFQPVVFYPVADAAGPYSVAVADVNGDGQPDLIAGNFDRSEIWVLLNNGDGTFQRGIPFGVGAGPGFVTTADVMGDGHTDLVVANETAQTISVVFNTCSSNAAPSSLICGISPTLATNSVGSTETVVAVIIDNSIPVNGTINFSILSGPNAGTTNVTKNTFSGVANFAYTSHVAGTDVIRAIATAAGGSATTTVTRVWIGGACPTITVAPGALPDGTIGTPYSQAITATGGVAPRQFAVTTGTLPAGLSLSDAGTLSGTPTALGAAGFTVTATDANDCTGSADYSLTINPTPPVPHNFAVTSLTVPKKVTLKAGATPKPGKVLVAIQNLGAQTEAIDAAKLPAFVTLQIDSLGACATPTATLQPLKTSTVTLKPKQSLKLTWLVTIACANDPAAGPGHEDYKYTVTVDPSALDGNPDVVPANNTCPRPPNPAIGDKGCGSVDPATKQPGADVLTDVFEK